MIQPTAKRDRTKLAVNLATERRWEEAVAINKKILEDTPDNVEGLNRLGKAESEMGRYSEARGAFRRALELSPSNGIAKKNLERIALLQDELTLKPSVRQAMAPNFFIEETGKTGVTALVDIAPVKTVAKLTAGESVVLEPQEHKLLVKNSQGEYIGTVEPRLGLRLLRLLRGGNKYAAAIAAIHDQGIKIIIRETYQHPTQHGRLSFPPNGQDGFFGAMRAGAAPFMGEDEEEGGEEAAEDPNDDDGAHLDDVSGYKTRSRPRKSVDLEGEEEEA